MTDQNNADPTRAGKLAQQVVAILINEDSVTRQRAIQAAMMLLGEARPALSDDQSGIPQTESRAHNHTDLGAFFNREEALKPADYAQLCAAYHFSLYGTAAFSLTELRAIAQEAGVVIPDRLDMTLNQATKKGKKFFQGAGRGSFRPTATAGLAFAERWDVKPGKHTKAVAGPAGSRASNA
jgi:hypothetical protein